MKGKDKRRAEPPVEFKVIASEAWVGCPACGGAKGGTDARGRWIECHVCEDGLVKTADYEKLAVRYLGGRAF